MSRLRFQLDMGDFQFYLRVIRSDGQWAALHLSQDCATAILHILLGIGAGAGLPHIHNLGSTILLMLLL